jgi:predicted acetyltransferase
MWGGATLATHRGKGYYTALVAARLQEAMQRGARFLFIDASPMSRPILERRGFVFLGFSKPCVFRLYHRDVPPLLVGEAECSCGS